MADKYLTIDATTGFDRLIDAQQTSAGAGDAGKIVALSSNGRLDSTVMPPGIGASTLTINATEALSAGNYVNIYNNGGTKGVRKASATDSTKPAHGFVLASVSSSANATVYLDGQNTAIPVGTFTAADVGKRLFLSTTAGAVTTLPSMSTGNIIQQLGDIVDVSATVTSDVDIGSITLL